VLGGSSVIGGDGEGGIAVVKAVCKYVEKTLGSAGNCTRLCLHHDGASFNGEDTIVIVATLPKLKKACYLPFMTVRRIPDVDDCLLVNEVLGPFGFYLRPCSALRNLGFVCLTGWNRVAW
jgi:hypothetical protein